MAALEGYPRITPFLWFDANRTRRANVTVAQT